MKKERLFFLDFIRAFATVIIVLTHYNALFAYNVNHPEKAVISLNVFNIYIGAFGVSLFLIISGAALMHVYGDREKIDWKAFFFKRFKTIFPIFWIAYALVFCINTYISGGHSLNMYQIPKWHFLFSILGVDGYTLSFGVPSFYLVGEWFLGFIIVFYLVFPFLLYLFNKFPIATCFTVFVLYGLSIFLLKDKSWYNLLLTVRLPEIVFGMFFIKYIKGVHWYTALICLCVLLFNQFLKPSFINSNIQVTYIGICSFVILVYIAKFLQRVDAIKRISSLICKYSYSCFIIHHWVIYKVVANTDLNAIGLLSSWILFSVCCVFVIFASYILQKLSDRITGVISQVFKSKKVNDGGPVNT